MGLAKRLHRLFLLGPRGYGKPVDKEVLESQYQKGQWDHLSSMDELARYGIMAAYLDRLHRSADVLDVGSGSGELLRILTRYEINSYFGIDLSATAIERAKSRFPNASFEVADFEHWHTSNKFDVIIFNESLYYAERPTETLLRYAQFLNQGGSILVSIYRHGQRVFIWRDIHKRFDVIGSFAIENQTAQTWDIEVLHPQSD